ncbi:MAG: FkbM family methyltransferase [Mediterranea sp.]|jgi:FkbM family methyltransferase|nr:FkbM family methyltransferase [Mediterranea sp.]
MRTHLRNLYGWLRGKSPFPYLYKECVPVRWAGNQYGGFYICPDGLTETSVIYSFGIGEDISFDMECMRQWGCRVYAFDPTPKSIQWLKQHAPGEHFCFMPYALGTETTTTTFYLPQNAAFISGSLIPQSNVDSANSIEVPVKKFADIAAELRHTHIDILKMDIEGAEYDVIPDLLASGVTIGQLLVEFHHRMFPRGNKRTTHMIKLLKKNGFRLFAYSDKMEEFSFINTRLR